MKRASWHTCLGLLIVSSFLSPRHWWLLYFYYYRPFINWFNFRVRVVAPLRYRWLFFTFLPFWQKGTINSGSFHPNHGLQLRHLLRQTSSQDWPTPEIGGRGTRAEAPWGRTQAGRARKTRAGSESCTWVPWKAELLHWTFFCWTWFYQTSLLSADWSDKCMFGFHN